MFKSLGDCFKDHKSFKNICDLFNMIASYQWVFFSFVSNKRIFLITLNHAFLCVSDYHV